MSEYQTSASTGRGLGDEVIYYRKPRLTPDGEPARQAGWITWGDSFSGTKQRDFGVRGFTPLREFGKINDEERRQDLLARSRREHWRPAQFQAEWLWGVILRHPDGPAQFPLEQIMTLRWYDPRYCPIKDVHPKDLFPQLQGHRIKEHPCPHCNRVFAEIDGVVNAESFANHLRITHDYDMQNVINLGDKLGIDFTGVRYVSQQAQEFAFGPEEEPEPEEEGYECLECGETFTGKMAKARLTKHMKTHPEEVPA